MFPFYLQASAIFSLDYVVVQGIDFTDEEIEEAFRAFNFAATPGLKWKEVDMSTHKEKISSSSLIHNSDLIAALTQRFLRDSFLSC